MSPWPNIRLPKVKFGTQGKIRGTGGLISINVFFTNEAEKNDGELLSTSFYTELRCASFRCAIFSIISARPLALGPGPGQGPGRGPRPRPWARVLGPGLVIMK